MANTENNGKYFTKTRSCNELLLKWDWYFGNVRYSRNISQGFKSTIFPCGSYFSWCLCKSFRSTAQVKVLAMRFEIYSLWPWCLIALP